MKHYTVYVEPKTWKGIKRLPGNIRQRVKQTIDKLAKTPRLPGSKLLDQADLPDVNVELWRFRLENWRIVYAIGEEEQTVDVLAVRKRPPYDYADLAKLLEKLQ